MTISDLKKNWLEWDYDNFSNGIVLYADHDFNQVIGSVSIYEMIEFIQTSLTKEKGEQKIESRNTKTN